MPTPPAGWLIGQMRFPPRYVVVTRPTKAPTAKPPRRFPEGSIEPIPTPLGVQTDNIPADLKALRAWVVWRYQYDQRMQLGKPPFMPDGRGADESDPSTWSSFDAAYAAYRASAPMWSGIGFMLSRSWLDVVGVDLDHVSEHRGEADRIVKTLNSYTEVTPSGDGLRIFVRAASPLPDGRRRKDWVEMYDGFSPRYLTLTGQHVEGTPLTIEHRQDALKRVFWQYLGADEASVKRSAKRRG